MDLYRLMYYKIKKKKNQIKRQNRKKMINQTKKVFILAPTETVI